jgi:ABC-type transporter Mla subunit MlaD
MGGLPNLEDSLAAAGSNGPALAELDNLVAVLENQVCVLRNNKPSVGGRDFDKLRLELSQQAEVAAGKRREAAANLRQAAAVSLAALRPLYEQHRHAREALAQAQASSDVIEKFIRERRPELGPTEQLAALKAVEVARQEELNLRVAYRQALLKLDLATRPIPGR